MAIRILDKMAPLGQQKPFSTSARATWISENSKRTKLWKVEVSASVQVTVVGTVVRNNGSVLALLTIGGFTQGSKDMINGDMRALRHLTEYFSNGPVPATRLTAAQAQALGTYTIRETLYFYSATPVFGDPSNFYFKEKDPQNQLVVFIQQAPASAGALLTDATVTITNLAATVVQVFDDEVANLPWFVPFLDMAELQINGASQNNRFDIRVSDYVQGILVMQDTTGRGEVSDIINSIEYLSDAGDIIGPGKVPFSMLRNGMADYSGGAGAAIASGEIASWYYYNHILAGRATALLPPNQVANLRMMIDAQPSIVAGAGTSSIKMLRVMNRRDLDVCVQILPEYLQG